MFIVRIYFVLYSIPTILRLKSVNWTIVLKNFGGRLLCSIVRVEIINKEIFHCFSGVSLMELLEGKILGVDYEFLFMWE